ncbi:HEPN domain-containing protein [Rickettsia hoogstraalii]|uniref:HEPN domain-containing protein n=1 Tax=Rickettsia hoogstraalii TaxID=467174 RepID=UPI00224D00A1|nr:HEPN domain-containing protein [Rickettsia hoogstraalii]MCX4084792.1 HEPN domain-containing protein [Rickettsia hoogstraalii]
MLSEAKDLPWSEMKEIAKDYYEEWFDRGRGFLLGANDFLQRNQNSIAAFLLHQATESLYSTILLVFSNYKPKLHDIKKLGNRAKNYNNDLLQVFPIATSEQKECFKLLKEAMLKQDMIKIIKLQKNSYFILLRE